MMSGSFWQRIFFLLYFFHAGKGKFSRDIHQLACTSMSSIFSSIELNTCYIHHNVGDLVKNNLSLNVKSPLWRTISKLARASMMSGSCWQRIFFPFFFMWGRGKLYQWYLPISMHCHEQYILIHKIKQVTYIILWEILSRIIYH